MRGAKIDFTRVGIIGILALLAILGAFGGHWFSSSRSAEFINILENRLELTEGSNKRLSSENRDLIELNTELGKELGESRELVRRARGVVIEFQGEIEKSRDTFERIERTVEAIGRIIKELGI